jgi:hypothetical protein
MQEESLTEYAKEFWSIANAVAGFSIVQNIAFYSVVGPHDGGLFLAVRSHSYATVIGIATATALYIWAIVWCNDAQKRLAGTLPNELRKLLRRWHVARLVTVVLMNLFALFVVWGTQAGG